MQRLSDHTGLRITPDRLRENIQLGLGKRSDSENQSADISLADAQLFFARVQGFKSWQALAEHITNRA